jgi:hypothetical protein
MEAIRAKTRDVERIKARLAREKQFNKRVAINAELRAAKLELERLPPVSGKLSAALLFLYFSGGRDRTMIWDTHQNARRLC